MLQNVVERRPAISLKSFFKSVAALIRLRRHTSLVTLGVTFGFPSLSFYPHEDGRYHFMSFNVYRGGDIHVGRYRETGNRKPETGNRKPETAIEQSITTIN